MNISPATSRYVIFFIGPILFAQIGIKGLLRRQLP